MFCCMSVMNLTLKNIIIELSRKYYEQREYTIIELSWNYYGTKRIHNYRVVMKKSWTWRLHNYKVVMKLPYSYFFFLKVLNIQSRWSQNSRLEETKISSSSTKGLKVTVVNRADGDSLIEGYLKIMTES